MIAIKPCKGVGMRKATATSKKESSQQIHCPYLGVRSADEIKYVLCFDKEMILPRYAMQSAWSSPHENSYAEKK